MTFLLTNSIIFSMIVRRMGESLRRNQPWVDYLIAHTAKRGKVASMPVAGRLLKTMQKRSGSVIRAKESKDAPNRFEELTSKLVQELIHRAEGGDLVAIKSGLLLQQVNQIQKVIADASERHATILKMKAEPPLMSKQQLESFAKGLIGTAIEQAASSAQAHGYQSLAKLFLFIVKKIPTTRLENMAEYTGPIFSAIVEDLLIRGLGKKTYLAEYRAAFKKGLEPYQQSHAGRLHFVFDWLAKNAKRHKIRLKTFCDVGCGAGLGAISTFEAKFALGTKLMNKVQVDGVDVVRYKGQTKPQDQGIHIYKHNYTLSPLPKKYDVILFANAHLHMTRQALRKTYLNLGESLNPSGLLVVAENTGGRLHLLSMRKTKDASGNYHLVPFYGAPPDPNILQI